MKRQTLGLGFVSVLAAVALLGCDEDAAEAACGAELTARVNAVVDASNRLAASAEAMRADVLAACEGIATDLGEEIPAQGAEETDDEYVERVCLLAAGAIDAEVTAGAEIFVAIQPPQCTVDAQAQLACEASCDVTGECDPGTLEARCEPGELSVVCEGTCDVNAYCEAQGDVTVECDGVCEGVCEGTCEGSTNAAGECAGTCTGGCRGSCRVEAEGGIDCGANARCRGGCTGTYSAPQCHAELTPPECNIDADCEAGCAGQASFNAECTEGQIVVVVEGGASENLAATLEANLPALRRVAIGLGDIFGSTAAFVDAAGNVVIDVANSTATCIGSVSGRVSSAAEAAVSAAATVTVSVSVSASVSGSAGVN
jgi:hypothetical protein